ncbi:hypothetical protein [Profundibacterium mesophilum]|uniref:Uncharacterized protein n=1 Tax=Profundibacterium mesophilum KAUST100406-0324 TaxID=1037889 RepID=A0A921TD33_9RHOB|nr:hypothetical protein [Profundibacterium mesophilum]KAF0675687.1 hypothetical protein PMES_02022 [Profundibacterium mesophilum KAUST100406-0324]
MSSLAVSAILGAAILVLLGLRATFVVRAERGRPRGSPPGKGTHVIDASYHSGGGGGGQDYSFTVPRDPDDYARLFVPPAKRSR